MKVFLIMHPQIKQWIERHKIELNQISKEIWLNPEVGYYENHAVSIVEKYLRVWGFVLQRNYCDIVTAWRAETPKQSGPVFAICAEYDALPEIGHACGHNLICTAALAAFGALAAKLRESNFPGQVVLLGTPAEESGGGKVRMLEKNCLDGIDAVMMVHPSFRTTPDTGCSAIRRYDVTFHGHPAHAAAAPELGRNALDAVMLLFAAVNAYRQQLPENARIHGIVTSGGVAPNIIPEIASCRFFLRSTQEDWIERIDQRFTAMVHGAELMTSTQAEQKPFNIPYRSRKPNAPMNEAFINAAKNAGLQPIIPIHGGRGSSDFGNFSRVIPGIHPYFAICDHEIAAHSTEFREAAGTELGFNNALKAAEAMAEVGWKFLSDDQFRAEVKQDFKLKD